jgi:hypothetical protein
LLLEKTRSAFVGGLPLPRLFRAAHEAGSIELNILVQSLVRKATPLAGSIFIRYWEKKHNSLTNPDNSKELQLASQNGPSGKKISYIVVRREYAYLEPVVRDTFKDAADIQILIDRRSKERRTSSGTNGGSFENRRKAADRRVSTPMLDVLINLNDAKP